MTNIQVYAVKCHENATLPRYKTIGAAGCDLTSVEDVIIPTGERRLVKTGLMLEIPSGFEGQVRPRSGLALKHGITVLNSPGTIDSDYRGELGVILFNTSKVDYHVSVGDSIAQLVISPVTIVWYTQVDMINVTERGDGGYGSTGR